MNSIGLIAGQEIRLNLRNKWVLSFAVLFTVLTLGLAYFGMVTSGYSGFQDFRRTSASIINLTAYLVPLFALLMGVFSFISNKEYFELLVTQPVSRRQIMLGKYGGLLVALLTATVAGFGISGVISALVIGSAGASRYLAVVGLSFLLAASFLSIAMLIAIAFKRQLTAVGTALGVWFFFIMFYDLVVISMTLYLKKSVLQYVLVFALLGNPVDMVRVMSLLSVGGTTVFGPAGATLIKIFGSTGTISLLFTGVLLLWIVLPLALAIFVFRRQDLT